MTSSGASCPKPPAVILAGGSARRMGGGDKLLLDLGGRTLLDHIVERLEPQVSSIAINANGDASRFPYPVIADLLPGVSGPLAGLHAALVHAKACAHVLTAPGDTPFLPADLVARLTAAAENRPAAIAASGGRNHPVIGLWRTGLLDELVAALTLEGMREMHRWVARIGAVAVEWPDDPFHNINTPEDLNLANGRETSRSPSSRSFR